MTYRFLQIEQEKSGDEQRAGPNHEDEPMMNSSFVIKELEDALTILKSKNVPGPDNITSEMLLHLVPHSKKKLLQMCSGGWKAGTLPQVWREAIMILILKKGKDKSKADSYSALPVVWENWWNASSTQDLRGTLKTKSTSHQSKQRLGKIGLLRTKSSTSLKLLKTPSKTRSTHIQYGLTWKRHLTRCGNRV